MPKKAVNVRLRPDQEEALQSFVREDPETDRSKLVRQAVDEFLERRKISYSKQKKKK
jgi:Arc/MetJ-type ribon-helix-helix transcriptional regulator